MALPIPMIALLVLSGKRSVMGDFVLGRGVMALAFAAALLILGLNALLVCQVFS